MILRPDLESATRFTQTWVLLFLLQKSCRAVLSMVIPMVNFWKLWKLCSDYVRLCRNVGPRNQSERNGLKVGNVVHYESSPIQKEFQFALVLGKCDKLAKFRRNRLTGSEDMEVDRKGAGSKL